MTWLLGAPIAVVATLGILCVGCGNGMRSESSNQFATTPSGVPFRKCPFGEYPPPPGIVDVAEDRRIAAADWVPGSGGAAVVGDEADRYTHQELFFVTNSGSLQRLPLPAYLRSAVSDVHLVPHSRPLLIVEEVSWTRSENTQWFMEEAFGVPDHGDLVVMDLNGVQRARHRSACGALLSPDRRWMAYWRVGDRGLRNLFVTRPEQAVPVFVAAIADSDPGSGKSFSECWSDDSRYLHLSGTSTGWRPVCWTYDVVAQELYSSGECTPFAM